MTLVLGVLCFVGFICSLIFVVIALESDSPPTEHDEMQLHIRALERRNKRSKDKPEEVLR